MLDALQKHYNLILGSGSPRRRQLLTSIGLSFTVRYSQLEESVPEGLNCRAHALFLANMKADDLISDATEEDLLITADTIVLVDEQIFGKPKDNRDAYEMIMALSGRSHEVITAVCISSVLWRMSFTEKTEVSFGPISDEEARWYIEHCDVLDKAGAYGIQDWIGQVRVKAIRGSFYNVVGLPTASLYTALVRWQDLIRS